MAKYFAEQSPSHDDCWRIYKVVEGYSRLFGPARSEHSFEQSVCGKTEEQVKELLKRFECPKVVTYEGNCND